ncbi:hypothetical protein CVT25_000950 [Psilocybe cyanescens]|uniref:Diacetyl reductase [(S)-acetoin forming] n=1 Tax=Psilocybe cyanescens TaxID=93625 RepID=A0A409XSE4_PSICY|nr:hypothetical protein CVT25_000950 [Psilocybe cyanescens]
MASSDTAPARRIALITGSAQGIGRAIALRLAEDGYDIALNDIPKFQSELYDLEEIIKNNTKSQAKTYIHLADVSIQAEINAVIDGVVKNLGGLDVMVANAGICIVKPFLETTTEDWDRIFSINTRAVFFAYQYAAKVMIAQGRGGRIIGACSGAGMQASPMLSAYSSTKFALRGLTQAAATELGKYGITVNAYAPGTSPEAARNPLGYIGNPEDVAGLVSYLASKESHFVNGQTRSTDSSSSSLAPIMSGIALVTGASRGIGRAIAIRLAKDGFKVAVNDLPSSKSELEQLCEEIKKVGSTAEVFFADVSIEEEVETMVASVVQAMGGLDVMVANAGICITKPLLETTKQDYGRLFGINVEGTFFCYKYAALQMIKQGRGGRIIGAASVVSKQGVSMLSAYSASKFAVRGLTQSAAIELAKHNITVNAYAPGLSRVLIKHALLIWIPLTGAVNTSLLQELRQAVVKDSQGDSPTSVRTMTSVLGRDSAPEDIAGLVSYLASKDAAMITGQSVSINGGMFFD